MGWYCPGESCSMGRWGKLAKLSLLSISSFFACSQKISRWCGSLIGHVLVPSSPAIDGTVSLTCLFCIRLSARITANIERFLLQTMTSNFCLKQQWIWQYTKIWNCRKNDPEAYASRKCIFLEGGSTLDLFHDLPGMKCQRKKTISELTSRNFG
jgi:hypothetical protein